MYKRGYILITSISIIVLIVAFMHFFNTSHNAWYSTKYEKTQHYTEPGPSHLTVVYERTYQSKQDLITLQVDSLYKQISKGAFTYKTVCNRTYTLKSFDGQTTFDISSAASACFIDGTTPHRWVKRPTAENIEGTPCKLATTNVNGERYTAWYNETLPHCHHNATPTDDVSGLIMELYSQSGDYVLKAKYIKQHIG